MMSPDYYKQFRGYAMQYGTFVGLAWTASFACTVGAFSVPFLGLFCYLLAFGSVVLAYYLVRRFRDGVGGGFLSFGRAFWFSLSMFFYASLLMAIAAYVYFRFLDNGYFTQMFAEQALQPDIKAALEPMTANSGVTVEQMVEMFGSWSPSDWTFNLLSSNMILALFLALFVALLVMRRGRSETPEMPAGN